MRYEQATHKLQTLWYTQNNLRVDCDKEFSTIAEIENNSLVLKPTLLYYKNSVVLGSDWIELILHSSTTRPARVDVAYANSYYVTLEAFPLDWLPFLQLQILIKGVTNTNIQYGLELPGTKNTYFYHVYETDKPVVQGNATLDAQLREKIKKVVISVHYYLDAYYALTDPIKPVYWKILFQYSNPNCYGG